MPCRSRIASRLPELLVAFVLVLGPVNWARAQDLAPLFSGTELSSGEQISLSDYRGKVVYLDFWASWCAPCLVSLPAYENMRSEIDSEDFEIIAINVDEDPRDGLEFLVDTPVSYPVLADPEGDIGIPYRVRSLPVAFLLDRGGRIVKRYRGFEPGDEVDVRRDIERLLNGNLP